MYVHAQNKHIECMYTKGVKVGSYISKNARRRSFLAGRGGF